MTVRTHSAPDRTRAQAGRLFRTISASVLFLSISAACAPSGRASQQLPSRTTNLPSTAALQRGPDIAADEQPRVRSIERVSIVLGSNRFSLHLPVSSKPPLPGVLVFHSALGRTDSVLEWCDALARSGFAAIALDFYDGRIANTPADSKALRDSANSRASELQRVVEQTYDSLQSDPRLRSQKRFLLGWSFGAAWATFASSFLPDVRGVVAYYGEDFGMNPSLYDKVSAPFLFIGAQDDTDPTPRQLHEIVGQLKSRGKAADLVLVDAMHGFTERQHPGYNAGAASESWKHAMHFLAAH
jgi:carboxymethylenebutenolidase